MAPRMKALRLVGVPYTGRRNCRKAALDVQDKTEMDALVAYP
jgi:cbb3-type cytochrome oxidase cytochrome c subunit